ncbi:MAG: BTAD domain-containing putative transcriptional regulator [Gaiellaceae bacterium]
MEFKVLGALEVRADGGMVELGPPRQRAVLAVLLLNANQVVTTDRLAEELWPGDVPKTAAKAIQVYVSSLRKAFGDSRDALETRGGGYVLRVDEGELDLHEFEQLLQRAAGEEPTARAATLRAALSLWRGDPLADLTYEPFVQPEAARLEALRQLALEERLEAELALGRGPELVPELETLVAERPLQERLRAQLMLALYRGGRQAEALDVFREGRRILDEELGLEPGPALRELEAGILRQDAELVAPATAPAPTIVALPEHADALDALASLAASLAEAPRRRGVVLAQIVPAGDLATATDRLGAARQVPGTRIAAFTSAAPAADIIRLAVQQDADLLLLATRGDPFAGPFAGVFADAPCDVATLVHEAGAVGAGAVVVPFGAFEHDWAALELGAWTATALQRPLQLIGTADADSTGRDASRLLADASLVVQHTTGVVAEPRLGAPGLDGLRTLAADAGLLVCGLSDRWRTEGLGATRASLVESPVTATLLVRRGLRPSGIAPPATMTRFTWSIERQAIRA